MRKSERRVPNSDGDGYITKEVFYPDDINVDKAIDEIYKVAKDMGADAITDLMSRLQAAKMVL